MYPYEKRRDAVMMVVAHGLSSKEAAAMLGYPSSSATLREWVREFRRTGGLHDRYGSGRILPAGDLPETKERRVGTGGRIEDLELRKAQLEREIREAELRLAVRRKAVELLGKGTGAAPETELTNREKAELVRDLAGPDLRQCDLLRAVGLARSTYNDQLRAMGRPDKYAGLRARIASVFEASGGAYGYRRVKSELEASGEVRSEKVVSRLMAEAGLVAKSSRGRRRWSSYEGDPPGAPPNLVGRDFRAGLPNFLWLTDISEFRIPAGKLYLSAVVDCFDGKVAGWATSARPDAELANSSLRAALGRREGWEATVVHSDRGAHYRWPGWVSICREGGLTRSMSRLGCSPDNSAMEGFFGRMKVEMFFGRDWSSATLDGLAAEIDGYIEWYNRGRIKMSLGGMSPAGFRRSLGLAA